MLKIINLDHLNTLPGGMGMPYDRAVVLDEARKVKHPITGEDQPAQVYIGTLSGAHDFLRQQAKAGWLTGGR